jgi:hypothetical protein
MIDVTALDDSQHNIIHYAGIRVRVNGVGNLRATFLNLDQNDSQSLVPLVMQQGGGIEILRLANYKTQRALLKIETTSIDEIFKINRIIVYAKPLWSSYPG